MTVTLRQCFKGRGPEYRDHNTNRPSQDLNTRPGQVSTQTVVNHLTTALAERLESPTTNDCQHTLQTTVYDSMHLDPYDEIDDGIGDRANG